MFRITLALLFALFSRFATSAQDVSFADSSLIGRWKFSGPTNLADEVIAVSSDSIIYIVTKEGGVWHSSPPFSNWTCRNNTLPFYQPIDAVITSVGLLASLKSKGSFLITKDSIIKSGGLEWLKMNGQPTQLASNGNRVLMLAEERPVLGSKFFTSVYCSWDGGLNFQRIGVYDPDVYGPHSYFDIHAPNADTGMYLLYRDSVAMLNYPGKLSPLCRIPIFMYGEAFLTGCKYGDSLRLYAQIGNYTYTSNNRGDVWEQRGYSLPMPQSKKSLLLHPIDSNVVFMSAGLMKISFDRGIIWKDISTFTGYLNDEDSLPPIVATLSLLNDSTLLAGHKEGLHLFRLSDFHSQFICKDIGSSAVADVYVQGDTLFASTVNKGLYMQIGSTANQKTAHSNGGRIFTSDSLLWLVDDSLIQIYEIPVLTGTPKKKIPHGISGLNRGRTPAHASDSNLLIGGGNRKSDVIPGSFIYSFIYKSDSVYVSRFPFNFDKHPNFNERISALTFSVENKHLGYAITNSNNFYFSNSSGNTWTKSTFFTGPDTVFNGSHVIYISKNNPQRIYVGGSGRRTAPLYVSSNGGRDFSAFAKGLEGLDIMDIWGIFKDSLLLASTNDGPYVYNKSNNNWQPFKTDSLTAFYIHRLARSNHRIVGASPGRGIWEFILQPKPKRDTIVSTDKSGLYMSKIYPNPFDNELTIENNFSEGPVSLYIYDLIGKEMWNTRIIRPGIHKLYPQGMKTGLYILNLTDLNGRNLLNSKIYKL